MFTGTRPRLCKNRASSVDKRGQMCFTCVWRVVFTRHGSVCGTNGGEMGAKRRRDNSGDLKGTDGPPGCCSPGIFSGEESLCIEPPAYAPSQARNRTHAATHNTQVLTHLVPIARRPWRLRGVHRLCRWETSGEAGKGSSELPVSVSGFTERRLKLSSLSSESLSALTAGWTSFLKPSPAKHGPFYISIAHCEDSVAELLWSSEGSFSRKRGRKKTCRKIIC